MMTHTKPSLWKRSLAALGAAAVATALLGFGAQSASAVGVELGNIEADARGSIEINKLTMPNGTPISGTGKVTEDPAGSVRLNDVEFTLYKLNLDLTTNAGWSTLAGVTAATAETSPGATPVGTPQSTKGNGQLTFGDLPVGAYLVKETDHSQAKSIDGTPMTVASSVAPFLVTIPFDIDGEWSYDVVTYPKNSTLEVDKKVLSQGIAVGTDVDWQISAASPKLSPTQELRRFEIVDVLDSRLEYSSIKDVTYGGMALADGDYVVSSTDDGSNTVTVRLTAAGLTKVKQNPGESLQATIVTKVVASGDGIIKNSANVITQVHDSEEPVDPTEPVQPGDPGDPTSPPVCDTNCQPPTEVPTPEPVVYFGAVNIQKQDQQSKKALSGAVFSIHATEEDARTGANPITVDGKSEFTTDDNGLAHINALKVAKSDAATMYYVHEVSAPAGYVTPSQSVYPVEVRVGTATDVNVVMIDNAKQNMPSLPLTGGAGTALFTVIGIVFVAGAMLIVMRNRRRAAAE